ncbi:hypothetical protein [Streptomyces sp. NBC_01439]|uniref:hypothetical protein n=1 Tax=Streptomyces sp. NBC_01439 TaxID=2903867 RepID=UPI002E2E5346|nr:hypothetical protein [Streptomyces sp. NBC_01439]
MNRDQLLDNYHRKLERIENSRTYSTNAKRVMAAKAYKETQGALEQIRLSEIKAIEDRREQLHRKMFGRENAADAQTVIARRDANDRAGQIDNPRIAAEQMQTALRQGDRTMAQAIAERAADWGWSDVLDSYAQANPSFRSHVQEYNELPDTDAVSNWGIQHSFLHVVSAPGILHDANSGTIEALASQDLEAA